MYKLGGHRKGDNSKKENSGTYPTVSVIIVNFNGGHLVAAAVEAIVASDVPVEVIVADNGSADGSVRLLRGRFAGNPRVKIIENGKNLGFTRANNLVLAHDVTDTDYVLLLNPDCIVDPDTLPRVLAAMEACPEAAMAGCLIRNPDGTEQAGCRRAVPTPWRTFVRVLHLNKLFANHPRFRSFVLVGTPLPKKPIFQEAISGAFMLVRRAPAEQIVGPLDEGYFLHCDDLDWCMRFRQAGLQILFVPDAEATHYKGYCSQDRPIRVLWHLHKGMVRFYRKFFRHQYPAPLMGAVILAVWARFVVLAMGCWVKRLVYGKPTFPLPTPDRLAPATQAPRPGAGDKMWGSAHTRNALGDDVAISLVGSPPTPEGGPAPEQITRN
ncbi:MAG: glycosyltransferase family 2 protein [Acidiferrobacterales bacterium]